MRSALALAVILLPTFLAAAPPRVREALPEVSGVEDDAMRRAVQEYARARGLAHLDLRLIARRESLRGEVLQLQQQVGGRDVIGATVVVDERDGEVRVAGSPAAVTTANPDPDAFLLWNGEARAVRISTEGPSALEQYRVYSDALTGQRLRVDPLFYSATARTRLFLANPVTTLNDPALRDQNDSALAVPLSAYRDVELRDVTLGAPLAGPRVAIVDTDAPRIAPVVAAPEVAVDRAGDAFEDVMAYHHIDSFNRYLESLGYFGPRAIAPYAIAVDAHAAAGTDNSYYVPNFKDPGHGAIYFGEGGTDDAEDPDIIVHEYGHAIQDWIAPNTFAGSFASEARALSEGLSDYFAFSYGYEESVAHNHDPFCISEWDARCAGSEGCGYPEGTDCLRRVDVTRTMADYVRTEQSGVAHRNGEIFSSLLREFFMAVVTADGTTNGRRLADTIVLESLFGTPSNPTFATAARRLVQADVAITGGRFSSVLCAAMARRGITTSGCAIAPRGEWTLLPSSQSDVSIPDANASGVAVSIDVTDTRVIDGMLVQVDIRHPHRGDLKITLVGPNGVPVLLQSTSLSDAGADFRVTYGEDAQPLESLEVFNGVSAAGRWTLIVTDVASGDVGVVRDWSLLFRFRGDTTVIRDTTPRVILPIVGHTVIADGRIAATDVALASRAAADIQVVLRFVAYGRNGVDDFRAVRLTLPPRAVVHLSDVVARTFFSGGLGVLEVLSERLDEIALFSRSYFDEDPWQNGQGIAAVAASDFARSGEKVVALVDRRASARANIGVVNRASSIARVRIAQFRGSEKLGTLDQSVPPHSGALLPLDSRTTRIEVEVVEGEIAAFVSTVDATSGDAWFSIARKRAAQLRVLPLYGGAGAHGFAWTSSLRIENPDSESRVVTMNARRADGFETAQRTLTLAAGGTLTMEDAARDLLGCTDCMGSVAVQAEMPLEEFVVARNGDVERRESIALTDTEPRREALFLFAQQDEDARTNLGLIGGEAPARVEVEVRDASGATIAAWEVTLGPREILQQALPTRVQHGSVAVTSSSPIRSYVSTVSNATSDSTIQFH